MDAFYTSPLWEVEAIIATSLIPIHFHLDKISSQYHLWISSLSKQYIINFLLDEHHSKDLSPHHMATSQLNSQTMIRNQEFYNEHL